MWVDTINVSGVTRSDDFRKWVMFHSLLFDSHQTVEFYDNFHTYQLKQGGVSVNKSDYENCLQEVYFLYKSEIKGRAAFDYSELYDNFLNLDSDNFDLVTTYLTHFETRSSIPSRQIIDYSYWQTVLYYSIIEKIIGDRPWCSKKFDCGCCGRKEVQHYKYSSDDWLNESLLKIIGDSGVADEYFQIIKEVFKKIRHGAVHRGMPPSAKESVNPEEGKTKIYDINSTLSGYKSDTTALLSMKILMREITRFLLLDHIFKFRVFPRLKYLRSTSISSK